MATRPLEKLQKKCYILKSSGFNFLDDVHDLFLNLNIPGTFRNASLWYWRDLKP